MDLRQKIENYISFNEQKEKNKEQFLKFIDTFDAVLTRDNIFGHFSASAFVVNKEKNKMVVVYHIINDGWIYPGGHADGEDDFLLAISNRSFCSGKLKASRAWSSVETLMEHIYHIILKH